MTPIRGQFLLGVIEYFGKCLLNRGNIGSDPRFGIGILLFQVLSPREVIGVNVTFEDVLDVELMFGDVLADELAVGVGGDT